MFLTLDDTNLQSGLLGIGQLSLSHIQSGPIPTLKIPLVSGVSASRGIAPTTFIRNSTATYIEDGLVKTAGIDVPRFHNGRYLCEPDGTNIALFSEELTNDYWEVNNITKTGGYSDPFGRTTGTKLEITNSTAGYILCRHLFDNIPTGTSTGSVFVKKGNHRYVGIRMFSISTSYGNRLVFDFDTETLTANGLTAGTYGVIKLANGWYRLWHNQATVLGSLYYASVGLTDSTGAEYLSIPAGSYIYATGFQVEAGTRATSYITTTTVPMDRVADVLHYAVWDVITQGQGSLYCEGVVKLFGLNQRLLNLSDNSTANRLYITLLANATLAAYVVSAGTVQTSIIFGVPSEGDVVKCLLTYKDNNASFYVNGVAVGTDITCQIPIVLNKLSVGCSHDSALQLGDEVGNIKYFKEALTEADAIKLTTL